MFQVGFEGRAYGDGKFRAAHTLARPLHQALVQSLATHPRVLAIVEDVLGRSRRLEAASLNSYCIVSYSIF